MPLMSDERSSIPETLIWYIYNTEIIEHAESSIDDTLPVFGITQTFKRNRIIYNDMTKMNRLYRRAFIGMFDKAFEQYCILPELHEDGVIHYHGWYTVRDYVYLHKTLLPKMRAWGFIKPKSISMYKIFDWKKAENGLHYYKKDCDVNCDLFKNQYVMSHVERVTSHVTDPIIKIKKTIIHHFTEEEYKKMLQEEEENIEENMKIFLKI